MTQNESRNIELVHTYLESLISHRVEDVRLADDCKRFENGMDCGWSGQAILDSLRDGPQYLPLREIRELTFRDLGAEVVARYLLDVEIEGGALATVVLTEHFVIADDRIAAITAIYEPQEM